MTGPSLLQAAVDELYSHSAAEFTTRRKALSVAAREAGDRDASAQIARLRKPTMSADMLNRLVRAAPTEVEELLDLGAEFRVAEKALDGDALRELSARRRALVGGLAQLAFDLTGVTASTSVRDEVVATLNAALADEQVAERLVSGALVTQARWDGFGSTSLPELATVLPLDRHRRRSVAGHSKAAGDRSARTAPAPSAAAAAAASSDGAEADPPADAAATKAVAERAAVKLRADREQRRRLQTAQREADDAGAAAAAAQQALADIDRRISELSMQLAHQRELLAGAQKVARNTETARRAAQLALTRAGGPLPT